MTPWIRRLLGRTPPGGIDCSEVGTLLQQYLDGYIDADRARSIEAHLERCRRCGMDADTYRHIKATLAAHRPEVPAAIVDRLRAFGERLAHGEEPAEP